MDLASLQDKLVHELVAGEVAAARKDPDDPLKGLPPDEAEKKAEELLKAALEAEEKIAALKAEMAPVLKLAKQLGSSRRFQQMVQAADAELVAIGELFVKLRETEGYYRVGTQDDLIKAVVKTNPELEQLLTDAKEDAKRFNQGFAKVQVWDKKPEDKRKKAPYEVKLSNERIASLDKEAGIWDVLKKALGGIRRLSDQGLEWARRLFEYTFENGFEKVVRNLRSIRKKLEAELADAGV